MTRVLTVSADGTRLYTFTSDTDLGEIDSSSLALLNSIPIVSPVFGAVDSLVYSKAQNAVYVTSYNSTDVTGFLYRVDLATFTITAQQSLTTEPLDVAVTPDGSAVYVASHQYPVGVFDGSTLAQTGTVNVGPTFSVVCGPF